MTTESVEFERRLHEEKLASLRQLAYGASHEINNPLGNIASRAQMLAERSSDPDLKRQLGTIYQQAMRAHEMISDMMLFAHPPKLRPERQNGELLVAEIERAFESSKDRLQFEFDRSIEIEWDLEKMAEAIGALIRNAIEADPDEKPIRIKLQKAKLDGQVEILVEDEGPGVSEAATRHLFDPFYSGREAGRGLGFGLSKAWAIAKLHGGDLEYLSQPCQGARFLIRLPIEQPQPKA